MWSTMILTRETVNMSKAEKLADSFNSRDMLAWEKQHDRWKFLVFLCLLEGEDTSSWDRDDWLCVHGNRG